MGRRNYLIEGVSGAGKTSVAEELERRGFDVIHGDRTLAYVGDPETGERREAPVAGSEAERMAWGHRHWIWPVAEVERIVADTTHGATFFCGGSRNHHRFIHHFDAVFVLEVDRDALWRRLEDRPEDEFGGTPEQRDFVLRLHQSREDIPASGISIATDRPVAAVVDDILARCGLLPPD